jgi:broad specificity phosphatase PhoE
MKLLLIRHGESQGNVEGRLQGHADFPLSELGREQARALARRLQREAWALAAVYTSDLSRAAETAEILGRALGAPVVTDERLREYDAGVLTGLVWDDIVRRYPNLARGIQDDRSWTDFPQAEGNPAFVARLVAVVADIQAGHAENAVVALVSHGGSLGMILAYLLGIETRRPTPFRFGNTSLSIVELTPRGPRLSLMNDTCHLDGHLR